MRWLGAGGVAVGLLVLPLVAQAAGSAQVAGRVVTEDGQPLAGVLVTALPPVALLPVLPPGTTGAVRVASPGAPVDAVSGDDGVFVLTGLEAGPYRLCAQAPGLSLVNPCRWSAAPTLVHLTDGQQLAGVTVLVARGARLRVRVEDRGRLLGLGRRQRVLAAVWTPQGELVPLTEDDDDGAGQWHAAVVPTGVPLRLAISGAGVQLEDEDGRRREPDDAPVLVEVPPGQAERVLRFTVRGLVP